jgi:hypothetical protein
MTIIALNSSLVERQLKIHSTELTSFHSRVLRARRIDTRANDYRLLYDLGLSLDVVGINIGFLGFMSSAYSNHLKIAISPHDLWYVVLTELGAIIAENVEACRPLFTRSESKVEILVPTGDVTDLPLEAVIEQLTNLIPVDIKKFIPELSTLESHSRLALYAALCDGVSPYYSYSTFCCGLPEIKVEGTPDDWDKICSCAVSLMSLFDSVKVKQASDYLFEALGVLVTFFEASKGNVNLDSWLDIFTQKNVGSGGELMINGWITKLFAYKCDMPKLENFSANIAKVDYKNVETGREFISLHGGFESTRDCLGFHRIKYSHLVFERIEKAEVFEKTSQLKIVKVDVKPHEIKLKAKWTVETPLDTSFIYAPYIPDLKK